jgi:hypothetical protein
MVILKVATTVTAGEVEVATSVTLTLKVVVPDLVAGVPEITPAFESASPFGSVDPLASFHVYGVLPPSAASVAE